MVYFDVTFARRSESVQFSSGFANLDTKSCDASLQTLPSNIPLILNAHPFGTGRSRRVCFTDRNAFLLPAVSLGHYDDTVFLLLTVFDNGVLQWMSVLENYLEGFISIFSS